MGITVIGIDPGVSGAIAIRTETAIMVHDMPTATEEVGGKARREVDGNRIASLLRFELERDGEKMIYVEKLQAITFRGGFRASRGKRQQDAGEASIDYTTPMTNFSMGKAYGVVLGVLGAIGVGYQLVSSQKWKNAMLGQHRTKDAAVAEAKRIFPMSADRFLKSKDGRAEAALIAEYGVRRERGLLIR